MTARASSADSESAPTVTAEQLVALEQRIGAAIFRESEHAWKALDETSDDLQTLVRTALAQLRAELAREVVTERIAIVDRYRREWIRSAMCNDAVQFEVVHPDDKLGLAVHIGVGHESDGGDAYALLSTHGDGVGQFRAGGGIPDPADGSTTIAAELWLESNTRDRDGNCAVELEDTFKATTVRRPL